MRSHGRGRHHQRGAAILLALLIASLVATMGATALVRHWSTQRTASVTPLNMQHRALVSAGLQWAAMVLTDDRQNGEADHLNEAWAAPMLQDVGPFFGRDVVMTTRIQDLSAKWNVWLLVSAVHDPNPDPDANHISIAHIIAENVGLPPTRLVEAATRYSMHRVGSARFIPDSPEACFAWLGLTQEERSLLDPYITCVPEEYGLNINTVRLDLLAWLEGSDIAKKIGVERAREPFESYEAIGRRLGDDASTLSFFLFGRPKVGWGVRSKWFTVDSTINYGGVAWRTRQTLKRTTQDIVPIGP